LERGASALYYKIGAERERWDVELLPYSAKLEQSESIENVELRSYTVKWRHTAVRCGKLLTIYLYTLTLHIPVDQTILFTWPKDSRWKSINTVRRRTSLSCVGLTAFSTESDIEFVIKMLLMY
jgi:hypothetical protein